MPEGLACSSFDEPRGDGLELQLERIQPELRAHLAHRSRRVHGVEPEDLAQEVVARALRYRDSYDAERALWPWLRRVAQHVLLDHRAASERHPQPLANTDVPAPEATPLAESREELERTLAVLRPLEREVLLRFHQRGESVRDIAGELGLPEGTVKSHLSRARRRLAGLRDPETNHE